MHIQDTCTILRVVMEKEDYQEWVEQQEQRLNKWLDSMERKYDDIQMSGVPIQCINYQAA